MRTGRGSFERKRIEEHGLQEIALGRRQWHPTPVFLLGKFYEQRSLVGFSLWGHQESDTIEQVNTYMQLR